MLTENFDNRDVALAKGELVIILDNERSGERTGLAGIIVNAVKQY